jgi:hypothetical protein
VPLLEGGIIPTRVAELKRFREARFTGVVIARGVASWLSDLE